MRKIIILFILFLSSFGLKAQLLYPDVLEHNNPNLPLIDPVQIKGSYQVFADIAGRNALPVAKRDTGMVASWKENGIRVFKMYTGSDVTDVNFTNETNWTEISGAGVDLDAYWDTTQVKNNIPYPIGFNGDFQLKNNSSFGTLGGFMTGSIFRFSGSTVTLGNPSYTRMAIDLSLDWGQTAFYSKHGDGDNSNMYLYGDAWNMSGSYTSGVSGFSGISGNGQEGKITLSVTKDGVSGIVTVDTSGIKANSLAHDGTKEVAVGVSAEGTFEKRNTKDLSDVNVSNWSATNLTSVKNEYQYHFGKRDTVATNVSQTLTIGSYNSFTVTGTHNIETIDDNLPYNTEITLHFTGNASATGLVDNTGNLRLNGNFLYTTDDIVKLKKIGTNWHEISRSTN